MWGKTITTRGGLELGVCSGLCWKAELRNPRSGRAAWGARSCRPASRGSVRDPVLGAMFASSGLPFNLPGGLKASQETGSLGSHGSNMSGSATVAGSGLVSAADGEPELPSRAGASGAGGAGRQLAKGWGAGRAKPLLGGGLGSAARVPSEPWRGCAANASELNHLQVMF